MVEIYGRDGQLAANYVYWLAYRDRAQPDARVAVYPYKRLFLTASSASDPRSGLTTMCYMPSPNGFHDPDSWYINQGAVEKAVFNPASMVNNAFQSSP